MEVYIQILVNYNYTSDSIHHASMFHSSIQKTQSAHSRTTTTPKPELQLASTLPVVVRIILSFLPLAIGSFKKRIRLYAVTSNTQCVSFDWTRKIGRPTYPAHRTLRRGWHHSHHHHPNSNHNHIDVQHHRHTDPSRVYGNPFGSTVVVGCVPVVGIPCSWLPLPQRDSSFRCTVHRDVNSWIYTLVLHPIISLGMKVERN